MQKEGERMYKNEFENVEVYFICDEREMNLIDVYYDEINDIHNWYINAHLAYKHWQTNFKNMPIGDLTKSLLTVAASRYLLYIIENDLAKTKKEYKKCLQDLNKIETNLNTIIKENEILINF